MLSLSWSIYLSLISQKSLNTHLLSHGCFTPTRTICQGCFHEDVASQRASQNLFSPFLTSEVRNDLRKGLAALWQSHTGYGDFPYIVLFSLNSQHYVLHPQWKWLSRNLSCCFVFWLLCLGNGSGTSQTCRITLRAPFRDDPSSTEQSNRISFLCRQKALLLQESLSQARLSYCCHLICFNQMEGGMGL